MPELPEVETVARQLAPRLVGRRVRRLTLCDPRLRLDGEPPRLAGRTVLSVRRVAKRVMIEFSSRPGSEPVWLAVHLRMTGRLLWNEGSWRESTAHLRARFDLDRGTLRFVDTRRFGTFTWLSSPPETLVGVEPLSDALTPAKLGQLLDGSRQNVKSWLLRQDRLVGLGNIYASEILHAARISPLREAGSLDAAECSRLVRATQRILSRAIAACGTTFSDFQDARGVEGSYQRFLAVYERAGEPCRRCREPIERIVQQQRSTYHCKSCQR